MPRGRDWGSEELGHHKESARRDIRKFHAESLLRLRIYELVRECGGHRTDGQFWMSIRVRLVADGYDNPPDPCRIERLYVTTLEAIAWAQRKKKQ